MTYTEYGLNISRGCLLNVAPILLLLAPAPPPSRLMRLRRNCSLNANISSALEKISDTLPATFVGEGRRFHIRHDQRGGEPIVSDCVSLLYTPRAYCCTRCATRIRPPSARIDKKNSQVLQCCLLVAGTAWDYQHTQKLLLGVAFLDRFQP